LESHVRLRKLERARHEMQRREQRKEKRRARGSFFFSPSSILSSPRCLLHSAGLCPAIRTKTNSCTTRSPQPQIVNLQARALLPKPPRMACCRASRPCSFRWITASRPNPSRLTRGALKPPCPASPLRAVKSSCALVLLKRSPGDFLN